MGNNGGTSSKLKKVARRFILLPCASLCSARLVDPTSTSAVSAAGSSPSNLGQELEVTSPPRKGSNYISEMAEEGEFAANISSKNVCTICLEPLLNSNASSSPSQAIFTSQCSHSFHLSCISSNIRHGSITCPICRSQWTRLPRNLHPPLLSRNQDDPIIRILDDSITTFRVHRRSFLRTARYNDDDPVEPEAQYSTCHPRLCFNLMPLDVLQSPWHFHGMNSREQLTRAACLSVRVGPQQAIDMVLVASPNGPHLRLLKQSMALVVFSLRPVDRLAIVSYSSSAARIFPLRRMTSNGKRAALQVIDRLFYAGHADPVEGIKKGIKILTDRTHENPHPSILHLSDYPTTSRSYQTINGIEMDLPVSIHQFHVASSGSIMHELEEFLGNLLGGVIREVQLRIGDENDARIVRLGELRGDEERRVVLEVDESHDHVRVGYSYIEGGLGLGVDDHIRVGEVVVEIGDRREEVDDGRESTINGGRTSCVDSWDYHDPYMARRWAKRLHGIQRI